MKEVQFETTPLSHLFTKLCAIIGGVFALVGVIDSLWFRLFKIFKKN
jgi:hypothetical protein